MAAHHSPQPLINRVGAGVVFSGVGIFVGSPGRRDGGVGTRVAGERLGGPLWSSCLSSGPCSSEGMEDDHKGPLHLPATALVPTEPYRFSSRLVKYLPVKAGVVWSGEGMLLLASHLTRQGSCAAALVRRIGASIAPC